MSESETLFLAMVPVPLVYLGLLEPQPLRETLDLELVPIGVFLEFLSQEVVLLVVLALAAALHPSDVSLNRAYLLIILSHELERLVEVDGFFTDSGSLFNLVGELCLGSDE